MKPYKRGIWVNCLESSRQTNYFNTRERYLDRNVTIENVSTSMVI